MNNNIFLAILLIVAAFILYIIYHVIIVSLYEKQWYRGYKGGVWTKIWYNKYQCWINREVEDTPHTKVLKTEDYR